MTLGPTSSIRSASRPLLFATVVALSSGCEVESEQIADVPATPASVSTVPPLSLSKSAQITNLVNAYAAAHVPGALGSANDVQAMCLVAVNDALNTPLVASPKVWCRGQLRPTLATTVNANTYFMIGSVTKIFVGDLLADHALRGKHCYAGKLAPLLEPAIPGAGDPNWTARTEKMTITLAQAAEHYSGLSRNPTNVPLTGGTYTKADLVSAFVGDQLGCDPATSGDPTNKDRCAVGPWVNLPGNAYAYSNFAYELLGDALGAGTTQTWYQQVRDRFLDPLNMTSTKTLLTSSTDLDRLAWANDNPSDIGTPAPESPGATAAGHMYSTPTDMGQWLLWHMGRRSIRPLSSYTMPSSCSAATGADPFPSTATPDPVINEAMVPRLDVDPSGPTPAPGVDDTWTGFGFVIHRPFALSATTMSKPYTLFEKKGAIVAGGAGTLPASGFHAQMSMTVRNADNARTSGVVMMILGASGDVSLVTDVLDVLESP